jgi:pimeloyl-ACP methyl ester carboxylesterase
MAAIQTTSDHLHLVLTTKEKIVGLLGDVTVPLDAIIRIRTVEDPESAVRGLRAPGLAMRRNVLVGTWRGGGRRSIVVARRRHPALTIGIHGQHITDLIVSVPNAEATLRWLRDELSRSGRALFTETDIRFDSGGLLLAGTVTVPTESPVAAALLVPASGLADRDSNGPKLRLNINRDIARALAQRGIATLRYDKRGVGESGGTQLHAGLSANHHDATAALKWLSGSAEAPTFLIGYGEGSIVAELLAAEHPELAGTVLLSAPARPVADTMAWKARQIEQTLPPIARPVVRPLQAYRIRQHRNAAHNPGATLAGTARVRAGVATGQWRRDVWDLDPMTVLPKIKTPVLAITGDKDLHVHPEDLDLIRETVAGPVDTSRLCDLTHVLRRDPNTAHVRAYKTLIHMPTDPKLIAVIGTWIRAQLPNLHGTRFGASPLWNGYDE